MPQRWIQFEERLNRNPAYPYALAVVTTGAAAGLRWAADRYLGGLGQYMLFYVPVVLVAVLGGWRCGLLAALLGGAAGFLLLVPQLPGTGLPETPHLLHLALYLLVAALIIALAEWGRRQRLASGKYAEETARALKLLDLAPVLVRDREDRITRWSTGCERLYGYPSAQALGQVVHELLKTRSATPLAAIRATLLEHGRWEGELVHTAADGRELVIGSEWLLLRDATGEPSQIIQANTDMTAYKTTDAALRRSEQRLRGMFDNAALGIVEVGPDDRLVAVNERFCEILGRKCADLIGTQLQQLTAPEDRPRSDALNQRMRTGELDRFDYEKRYLRGDGRPVWVHVTVSAVRDLSGRFLRAIGTVENIEARRQTEAALRESEQRLRDIMDHANAIVWLKDLDGRFILVNRYTARVLNRSVADIVGRTVFDLFPRELADQYAANDRIVLECGAPQEFEETVGTGPDARTYVAVKFPLRDLHGQVYGLCAICTDITERKQAESVVQTSERSFRELADAMPQIVWAARPDGHVDYYNRRWYELTGAAEGAVGDASWLPSLHPDDREKCLALWYQSVRTGEPYQVEYRYQAAPGSGEYRWHLGRALPVHDDAGRIVRWYGTSTDINEYKRAEADLAAAKRSAERAKADAEAANRAKDHFLAVLSHEMRTPLTPVLATTALMLRDPRLDEEQRENLEVIRRNTELESRLIDDLLDLTRIVRGKVELNRRPVALFGVLQHAVEVCRPDLEAQRLHFSLASDCTTQIVNADAARLQQVFWNLLKNAIKFTPPDGCVGVRCWQERNSALIAVTDSGEGIEPEELERIFEPFEQGERGQSRRLGGLGLGLAICRGLVEMHGGSIAAASAGKGRGATFTVRLPLATEPAAAPDEPPPRHHAGTNNGDNGKPLRILLVEDHVDTARIMARFLSGSGHAVRTAATVAHALDEAGASAFDLLISDLGLPDGSGIDLLRELRVRGHNAPAIALTGFGQREDLERSRAVGFAAHLTKPVDLEQLERAMADAG